MAPQMALRVAPATAQQLLASEPASSAAAQLVAADGGPRTELQPRPSRDIARGGLNPGEEEGAARESALQGDVVGEEIEKRVKYKRGLY